MLLQVGRTGFWTPSLRERERMGCPSVGAGVGQGELRTPRAGQGIVFPLKENEFQNVIHKPW